MKRYALNLSFFLTLLPALLAHDPGLSTIEVQLTVDRLRMVQGFAPQDLENHVSRPGADLSWAHLRVEHDGQILEPVSLEVRTRDQNTIEVEAHYRRPDSGSFSVRSPLLSILPSGHRQFVSVQSAHGGTVREFLLDRRTDRFEVPLNTRAPAARAGFVSFFWIGVEHILTGYDHLLFLFALLIVGSSFLTTAKVISSFTIAHSITLVLGFFDLIRIPPGVVEPLIALSVIIVGLENIRGRWIRRRWLLAFGFGLIHGLGFASALQDLGIAGGSVVVPLLSFNLGVEIGQLGLAGLLLPLIWVLKRRPSYVPRVVPTFSCLVVVAGLVWLVERI